MANVLARPTRRLSSGLQSTRLFSSSSARLADYTHTIVGAGAVGLAISQKLSSHPKTSTLLLERNDTVGSETSSRNSEVIHAGLYYGQDSLKTKLCLRGKELMYETCAKHNIGHWNCGKWIVAQDEPQWKEMVKVFEFARLMDIPIRFVPGKEVWEKEPAIQARAGVLESPTTGIVDSHGLMAYLESSYTDNGGDLALRTKLVDVEKVSGGYKLYTTDYKGRPNAPITTEALINCAGLFAPTVNNMVLPDDRRVLPFFAKGTYYSYSSPNLQIKRLVYPAPVPGHGGLGTHLTLDLSDPPKIRFGPDVEWVSSPNDYTPNEAGMEEAIRDIMQYLPDLDPSKIQVDYCGIRPKLGEMSAVASGSNFQDFIIRHEKGYDGFINLLGIESPGLTSCLAIAEEVDQMLY